MEDGVPATREPSFREWARAGECGRWEDLMERTLLPHGGVCTLDHVRAATKAHYRAWGHIDRVVLEVGQLQMGFPPAPVDVRNARDWSAYCVWRECERGTAASVGTALAAVAHGDMAVVLRWYDCFDLHAPLTPIRVAVERNAPDMVRVLCEAATRAGVRDDVRAVFAAALRAAAAHGFAACIEELLAGGVPVGSSDVTYRTALHEACRAGHVEAARVLLAAGADPLCSEQSHCRTPVWEAMQQRRLGVLDMLLDAGVDITEVNHPPHPPLVTMCSRSSTTREMLDRLWRGGVDVAVQSRGRTCLCEALLCRRADTCEWLVERGARVDIRLRAAYGRPQRVHEAAARVADTLPARLDAAAMRAACEVSARRDVARLSLTRGLPP